MTEPAVGPDDLDLLRRRVLTVIGHELRTPVTTLRGLAEQLATSGDASACTELVDAVLRNAVRLERLVDDLLVAAGVDTALPEVDGETTAVAAAVGRAWQEVAPGEPLDVDGDASVASSPLTLSRMLRPVLDNAHTYGTGRPRVRVGVGDAGDVVTIEVDSPGAALTAGDAVLATEPFYRGESAVPVAHGLGLGLTVCYDLRFPELYRILALRGARIVTVPANFTRVTGEAHWEILLRARAIENQVFAIAPGQGNRPGPEGDSYGNSMIVDPWGEVLARAPAEGEHAIVAELDLARQDEVREKLPSLANRVEAAYVWPEKVTA